MPSDYFEIYFARFAGYHSRHFGPGPDVEPDVYFLSCIFQDGRVQIAFGGRGRSREKVWAEV